MLALSSNRTENSNVKQRNFMFTWFW